MLLSNCIIQQVYNSENARQMVHNELNSKGTQNIFHKNTLIHFLQRIAGVVLKVYKIELHNVSKKNYPFCSSLTNIKLFNDKSTV